MYVNLYKNNIYFLYHTIGHQSWQTYSFKQLLVNYQYRCMQVIAIIPEHTVCGRSFCFGLFSFILFYLCWVFLYLDRPLFDKLFYCNGKHAGLITVVYMQVDLAIYISQFHCFSGVWTADLTITQLFLEDVAETERGLVNGFQSSLNKLMDMLKFVMVIFISDPSKFGYPAIVSYCFICSAWILYAIYKKRSTGRILCCKGCVQCKRYRQYQRGNYNQIYRKHR